MSDSSLRYVLGVDTGGTFTDFVLYDLQQQSIRVHKVLSTPTAPEHAILQGVDELGLGQELPSLHIFHGSTVATNAVLEGKGCRVAYIANIGFADVLSIGRQARENIYDLQPVPIPPPVPAELCLETAGRLSSTAEVLEPLTDEHISELRAKLAALKPDAVAINHLFSWLDNDAEQRLKAALVEDYFVSCSSDVLAEIREYERGIATWLNAYVGPKVSAYLDSLVKQVAPAAVTMMQSSGGTIGAEHAGTTAVNLLLSGPAGGLAAAKYLADQIRQPGQRPRLMTFDMGGTSSDVALIDGDIGLTSEGKIGRYPVAVPMVDMHTIGAGGGSIAYVDAGGLLQVGPQSAGSNPGPACYGLGGTQPTVTDANAVLGRIRPDGFLGGKMDLDLAAAQQAMQPIAEQLQCSIEEVASGIIGLANEHMARALRVISVQRGENPKEYALMSFGGAGGMHVCALAEALAMKNAVVPVMGGVLSALGMLVAPASREFSQTINMAADKAQGINELFTEMQMQGHKALLADHVPAADIEYRQQMDMRYRGQSSTLSVPWQAGVPMASLVEQFHDHHHTRFGHRMAADVEIVTLRLRATGKKTELSLPTIPAQAAANVIDQANVVGVAERVPVYQRETLSKGVQLSGPAIIVEQVSTTWLAPDWVCEVDRYGNLLLQCKKL